MADIYMYIHNNICAAELFVLCFIHSKLELLTQLQIAKNIDI